MNYENLDFCSVIIEEKNITDKHFYYCRFENCCFKNIIVQSCSFHECDFLNCTIENVRMRDTGLKLNNLYDCKLLNLRWCIGKSIFPPFESFLNCTAKFNDFYELELKGYDFSTCTFIDCTFEKCNLEECNFSNTKLNGTSFSNNNLSKARFENASGYRIFIENNKLKGAVFSYPEVLELLKDLDISIV